MTSLDTTGGPAGYDRAAWERRFIDAVDASRDELVQFAGEVIRTPSENPEGDCTAVAALIERHLTAHGATPQRLDGGNGRISLLSRIGASAGGRHVVLSGHMDTVPIGDRSRWSFDPFAGDVVDGLLRGRGASDMKGGLAGLIHAFVLLRRLDVPLPGVVSLLAVPDEETGGDRGADWALEQGVVDGADGAVIAEPAERSHPTIGQKGSNWFRLTIHGKPGHGSLQPVSGVSANLLAAKAILALQGLWDMQAVAPADAEELVARSARWAVEREGYSPEVADVFRRVTVNIGTMHGGVSPNVVADTAVVEVDTRVPIGLTRAEVLQRVQELLADAGVEAELEPIGFCSEPNYTVPSDPIVVALVESLRDLGVADADGVLQWASSDARCFRSHGIPVLQYGPATLPTIHGYDETCPVEDLVLACKVYGLTVLRFLADADPTDEGEH